MARYQMDFGTALNLYGKDKTIEGTSGVVLTHLAAGHFQVARAAADALVAAQPSSAKAHAARAEVLYAQLQIEDAVTEAQQAMKLDHCEARAYYAAARIDLALHHAATAWTRLQIARQLRPNDEDIHRTWLLLNRAPNRFDVRSDYIEHSPTLSDRQRDLERNNLVTARAFGQSGCTVVAPKGGATIPLRHDPITGTMQISTEFGKLKRDTSIGFGSGLFLPNGMATRLGLKPIDRFTFRLSPTLQFQEYTAILPSLRIGDVELKNCIVAVADRPDGVYQDETPSIGIDVLRDFLIDFDPTGTLTLSALPNISGPQLTAWPAMSQDAAGSPSHTQGTWPLFDAVLPDNEKNWAHIYDVDGDRLTMVRFGPGQPMPFGLAFNSHHNFLEQEQTANATSLTAYLRSTGQTVPEDVKQIFNKVEATGFAVLAQQLIAVSAWTVPREEWRAMPPMVQRAGTLGYPALGRLAFTFDLRSGRMQVRRTNDTKKYPGFDDRI